MKYNKCNNISIVKMYKFIQEFQFIVLIYKRSLLKFPLYQLNKRITKTATKSKNNITF